MADVSVAISAAAVAAASHAEDEAAQAKCIVSMHGFQDTQTTTVEAKREYAACVYRVYGGGSTMTPETVLLIKTVIVFALIGMIMGAIKSYRDWGTIVDAVIGAVAGACCGALGIVGILGVVAGVEFLFT